MESTVKRITNPLLWRMDQWDYMSCSAEIFEWPTFATLYSIKSLEMNKWHAQKLLMDAKEYYESRWKKFGWTVALNPTMKHIYKKLKIKEYK